MTKEKFKCSLYELHDALVDIKKDTSKMNLLYLNKTLNFKILFLLELDLFKNLIELNTISNSRICHFIVDFFDDGERFNACKQSLYRFKKRYLDVL